jgi:hypothetical protein
MDIASIASSFGRSSSSSSRPGNQLFTRAEFEEFLSALKQNIDAATSIKEREHAHVATIDTVRSRLLSGKQLTCRMVRIRIRENGALS